MPRIRVKLMRRKNRDEWECYWRDPISDKQRTRTTGTSRRTEADRFAARLEDQLNTDDSPDPHDQLWQVVADRYETEVLASRAPNTLAKWKSTRGKVETVLNPKYVRVMTAGVIGRLQTSMRDEHLAEATIKSHLVTLRAFLRWANRNGLLRTVPNIDMPKRINKMKGRPITGEEFDRMKAAIETAFPPYLWDCWRFLLDGLWLSGLRLGEALKLTWEPSQFYVVIRDSKVRLKIEANADKSTKPQLLPLAEDFAAFLLKVPEELRVGHVFTPAVEGQRAEMRLDTCSDRISKLGKAAKVMVAEYDSRPRKLPAKRQQKGSVTGPRKKWASAHDLRRAFGNRWAKRLMPAELKILMRHKSMTTTMDYYSDIQASDVEEAMRSQFTNKSTNIEDSQSSKTG